MLTHFFFTIVLTATGDLDIQTFGFETDEACRAQRQVEYAKALVTQKPIVITTCQQPLQPISPAQLEQAMRDAQPVGGSPKPEP